MDKSRKSILFVIGSMGKGGAERVISLLANHYVSKGWNVKITMLLNNQIEYSLDGRVELVNYSKKNKYKILMLPYWLRMLRHEFKKNKPDVIVSFIARINIITLIASMGIKSRKVISERSDPRFDGRNIFTKFLIRIFYPLSDSIIFQSESVKILFSKKIQSKGIVIRNPIYIPIERKTSHKEKIVTIGRLQKEKNHFLLIDAFEQIERKYPNYKLYIYGEGDLRNDLENYIFMRRLQNKIILPGKKNNVHEEIADASIFVLSSNHEGLSNALLEAMMMGFPCISTKTIGTHEIITQMFNGLLIDIGNKEQLIHGLLYLINNLDKADEMGNNAKKSVEYLLEKNIIPLWENVLT